MNRYLVVQDFNDGMAHICNVGVFDAPDSQLAIEKAKKHWHSTMQCVAFDMNELNDRWTYMV